MKKPKKNIEEIQKNVEKAAAFSIIDVNANLIADVEDALDIFYNNDYSSTFKLYDFLCQRQIGRLHAKKIIDYYKPIYKDVLEHQEDYFRNKKQYANYLAFLKMLIDDAVSYVDNKNAQRKPRKLKEKKTVDLIKNVKYKKENVALNLVSLSPETIIDSKIVILYNDKYNRVTILYSKEGEFLSIKGTTIQNFDETKSFIKVVRKPQLIRQLINGAINIVIKNLIDLKEKPTAVTSGRLTQDTLILKGFK